MILPASPAGCFENEVVNLIPQHLKAFIIPLKMTSKISIETIYHCSLERAFKSPMLCDVSKVHTGDGIMPRVTHCTEDENWGKPGFTKKVFVAKSVSQPGGFASVDKVIDRIENTYWKIEVTAFQA